MAKDRGGQVRWLDRNERVILSLSSGFYDTRYEQSGLWIIPRYYNYESIFDDERYTLPIERALSRPRYGHVVSLPTSLNAKGSAGDNCSCRGTKLRSGFRAVSRLRATIRKLGIRVTRAHRRKGEKNGGEEEEEKKSGRWKRLSSKRSSIIRSRW